MPLIRAASTVSTQGSHTATLSTSLRSSTVSPPRVSTVTAHATTTATGVQSATAVSGALQIQSSNFPVRIVVGSVAGGMALAIVVVLVWTYLGKSFRRQRQDQARTLWTSKNNKHGPYSQCIHTGKRIRPSEKTQPLTSSNNENEKAGSHHGIREVSTPDSIVSTPPRLLPPQLVFKPANCKISQPRTLRKDRRHNRLIDGKSPLSPITDVDNEVVDALLEEPLGNPFANHSALNVNAPGAVTHKPSVIGSASVYSTESGEERQNLGDPSFALATLGPPGLDTPTARPQSSMSHKLSNVSSIYSSQSGEEREFGVPSNFLTMLGPDRRRLSAHSHGSGPLYFAADERAVMRGGARNAGEGNAMILSRLSQVSSVSDTSRVDGQSAVGIAYGGEE